MHEATQCESKSGKFDNEGGNGDCERNDADKNGCINEPDVGVLIKIWGFNAGAATIGEFGGWTNTGSFGSKESDGKINGSGNAKTPGNDDGGKIKGTLGDGGNDDLDNDDEKGNEDDKNESNGGKNTIFGRFEFWFEHLISIFIFLSLLSLLSSSLKQSLQPEGNKHGSKFDGATTNGGCDMQHWRLFLFNISSLR